VSGLDHALAVAAFDPARNAFVGREIPGLELFGHKLAKSAVWLVWFSLAAAAIASHRLAALAPWRRALWAATAAMALGPALVSAAKMVTGPRCPWDLAEFGGTAQAAVHWFAGTADAGRCFPSGHASGGFSLIALYYTGLATGSARLRNVGLALALGVGTVFSAIRMIQGAHFLSHNLWSMAVAWVAASLVFRLVFAERHATVPTTSVSSHR
jgi:membrane-associated PAP2 superfamily phosphatase